MKCTLTLLDTMGIQDYIFASNRLRENIGASELVEKAIKEWAFEILDEMFSDRHNVKDLKKGKPDTTKRIEDEDGDIEAEVLYSGGGNTAILFKNPETARSFTRRLSRRVLTEAPGLQFAVAHQDGIDFEQSKLPEAVQKTLHKVGKAKRDRPDSIPTLGLSVTAECQSTGLPAGGVDPYESSRLVSSEVTAKVKASEQANDRLEQMLSDILQEKLSDIEDADKLEIPLEFDSLGRIHGEESYLAVVHADGNSMGQRIVKLADDYPGGSQEKNREYIKAMRKLSKSIDQAGRKALCITVKRLLEHKLEKIDSEWLFAEELPLAIKNGNPCLPFRPLVYGGDDVTFVCNGQLGLFMAVEYLKAFEQQQLEGPESSDGSQPTACAGVAVVKLHYPFARACSMSDELCQSAKKIGSEQNISALDWHFSTTGLSGDLELIREREYTVKDGQLYLRPLRLSRNSSSPNDLRTWPVVKDLIQEFSERNWASNKVKRLRSALREGPEAVRLFTQALRDNEELPKVSAFSDNATVQKEIQNTGWKNGRSVYFDAIEAMDHSLLIGQRSREADDNGSQ